MICFSQPPWGLAAALVAALGASATPAVNVGLKAAFPAGPYLLELLETAAAENSTAYFPLLGEIASGRFASASSEADLYTSFLSALREGGHITSPEALSTFNLALSLRNAAPRIEAHYQYYTTSVQSLVEDKEDCQNWVLIDRSRYCSPSLDDPVEETSPPQDIKDLPFDRTVGASGKDAVLYADPTSDSFSSFHQTLYQAAHRGELRYRLRYRHDGASPADTLPVSGYGVELALKRTDYIVIDDREATPDASQQPLTTVVLDEEEEVADLKPLSTSELAELGLKAASFIMHSDEPLDTLIKLTQDLPKFSTSIAAHDVSESFLSEHKQNRKQMAPAGINYLWMNGAQLIERQIEPFTLIDMVRRERKFLSGVLDLGFSGKQAISLLGHKRVSASKASQESPRFDWTDQTEEGRVIMWLNDLENDERYATYPSSLKSLLQRTYPGQLPPIAKNVFTLILPVDLANSEDTMVVSQVLGLMKRGIPIRFGIVPLTSTSESSLQAKLAYHLVEDYGVEALVAYLKAFREEVKTDAVEKLLDDTTKDHELQADASAKTLKEVLESEDYSHQVKLAHQWSSRLGANTEIRPVFADGVAVPRDKSWMQTVSMKLAEDLQSLQMALYKGLIDEETWAPGFFLEKAASRRNTYILPEDDSLRILDASKIYADHTDLFNKVPIIESYEDSTKENWAVLSVIADATSASGQELLLGALAFKRNNPSIRLEIIHNPESRESAFETNAALHASQKQLGDMESTAEINKILEAQTGLEDDMFATALDRFLTAFNLQPGKHVLLLNGRIIGPISPEDSFLADDFQQLLELEQTARILPVYAAIDELGLGDKLTGPISAAKVTSLTALSTISDLPEGIFESASTVRTSLYDQWESDYTAIESGDPDTASVHIAGLLNPLSEQGQRWAPILKVLSELDGVYLKLFLNPKEKIEELPVKRFFRYVLESKPSFDETGKLKVLNATFKGLPSEALLTAGMNVPPAWLVASEASVHDLDNIKLSTIKNDVEALYELEHILIEGHSREGRGTPPRGAQLALATGSNPLVTDTIAMSNLGYFQFKANPGFYNITLKEGRSTSIYSIESIGAQGWEPVPGDEGTEVAIMDFQGTTLYPRLRRNPGMEHVDVLGDDDDSEDSIVSKGLKFAESLLGGSKKGPTPAKQHADINIFSVASGHLYERMLNIMIVSVMRNTKHTVKFWFIEQFLSPSFKDFIPYMAEEYGFEYEMVTYKWPHWLRQQKEKQREIWGYKILFLDVLFPLSLDKVIFVDADQIVRTDMIDLVNHDLKGAPYGFTPMCDSRTEMEGFRFWKQGYWASHLRGLPYHISALYVVDLRRFRELGAGDRLRQQYHTLSADPNSLSNLDQDLPNNMQFQIPIHSLPQEWLWCETWCSDEGLSKARTIDLCNNPETKEPKLDRARRQVPEWTVYDDEIAALDRRRRGTQAAPEQNGNEEGGVNTKSRRFEEEPVHTRDEL